MTQTSSTEVTASPKEYPWSSLSLGNTYQVCKTANWALILFIPGLLANLPSLPTDGLNRAGQYPVFKKQTKLIHQALEWKEES